MSSRRPTHRARLVGGLALALLAPAAAPAAVESSAARARLNQVTVRTEADTVTVHLKISGPARYQVDLIPSPDRLVVDLPDTTYGWRRAPLAVTAEPLRQIRGSQYQPGVARMVFELSRKVGYAVRDDDNGLVISIPRSILPDATAVASAEAARNGAPLTPTTPSARMAAKQSWSALVGQVDAGKLAQATPTPAPSTPPSPAPRAPHRLISLDFKDADVVNLLRILAAESGRNIVIGDDVKGKMSITLRNVPWDVALETVMEARGLQKVEKENVLRIVSTDQLIREREARFKVEESKLKAEADIRAKQAEAVIKEQEAAQKKLAAEVAIAEAAARGPLREETIRLSYADPEDVAKTLQGILGISAEGIQAATTPIPYGPPPIPQPPFSQLFGPTPPTAAPALVSPTAEVLAKGITIRAHKPTNSVFIRHYAADLERIKKLIAEKLDVPLPQVKIEARMEILDREDLFAIGVQWGAGGIVNAGSQATVVGRGFTSTQIPSGIAPSVSSTTIVNPNFTADSLLPISAANGLPAGGNVVNLPIGALLGGAASAAAGGLSFGIIGTRLSLDLALEALRTENKTRSLARPEVVTVENNKAVIQLGEEIPYATVSSAGTQVQFKEAVLKLEVTPTVIREREGNKIKMKVVVENNSRGAVVDLGSGGNPPAINKRKAETEVLVREGERLVIGGVTTNIDQEQERKLPLFGDIPVLGWLFKQRGTQTTGRELVVFITPSVLRQQTASAPATGTPIPSPR